MNPCRPKLKHICLWLATLTAAAALPAAGASAYTLATLYSFCAQPNCSDGQGPQGDLTMDAAGNIFGTTAGGGDRLDGVVFEIANEQGSWTYRRLYSFCAEPRCEDGIGPAGHLVVDVAGNIYGTARFGGAGSGGIVFELRSRKDKWKFEILYPFCSLANCADGDQPSGLTYQGQAAGVPYDGHSPLYGTTETGGTANDGVVFEVRRSNGSWTESVVYNFCSLAGCADGSLGGTPLVADGSGTLFGVTGAGGAKSAGTIFELRQKKRHRWKETVLYSFCSLASCADGFLPNELVMDAAGSLFGTGALGGTGDSNSGVVFKLIPNGTKSQYSVLYDFCTQADCDDGSTPIAGLTVDTFGNIFGTTKNGGGHVGCWFSDSCGTAFEISGSAFQVIHAFCSETGCADGAFPYTNLMMDQSNNLFGMAELGGAFNGGSIYELTP